jgi:glutamate synthase (NADPH/NADH) small chain
MGDIKGFLKIKKKSSEYRQPCERVRDFKDVAFLRSDRDSKEQSSRCMDCGTAFCNWGCPVGNYIPEWNDFVFKGQWDKAFELLDATNDLPEITGRICPALCEYACVLGINDEPVTIREDELAVIEHAFKKGFIRPRPPLKRSGKKVAVIGSGPAGLSCAARLNRAGYKVVVYEKDDKIGGIMRYGIPDFKLEKWILDRRIDIWKNEGIEFKTSTLISKLPKGFDAVCLAGGSRVPRDIKIKGRELNGIHFAMDYLVQSNKKISGYRIPENELIDAKGKKVVVIGGGDTGADCVGTANRQKAKSVTQIEIMPKPSEGRPNDQPWPKYPNILKTSTSHGEGCTREWAVLTREFAGDNGQVTKMICVKVDPAMKEITGSGFEIEADLVILALGFLHPEPIKGLELELDDRGNIKTDENYMTSKKGVFSAGDMRKGQSLVVWAISEGRRCADLMDKYLMSESKLPAI